MMDEENTKVRNEIMRRIKNYQVKERNLPNFVRKKREEMLAIRVSNTSSNSSLARARGRVHS